MKNKEFFEMYMRGKNYETVAEDLGCSVSKIYKIVNGKANCSLENAKKFNSYFKTNAFKPEYFNKQTRQMEDWDGKRKPNKEVKASKTLPKKFKIGQLVKVINGEYEGLEGIVKKINKSVYSQCLRYYLDMQGATKLNRLYAFNEEQLEKVEVQEIPNVEEPIINEVEEQKPISSDDLDEILKIWDDKNEEKQESKPSGEINYRPCEDNLKQILKDTICRLIDLI